MVQLDNQITGALITCPFTNKKYIRKDSQAYHNTDCPYCKNKSGPNVRKRLNILYFIKDCGINIDQYTPLQKEDLIFIYQLGLNN